MSPFGQLLEATAAQESFSPSGSIKSRELNIQQYANQTERRKQELEQQSLRPNFNLKIPPVSGRDPPNEKNVLSMASLIVRRHSNSRVDRERSSDQENETVNTKPAVKLAPNLDVPKLAEYKSNRAEM